MVSIMAREILNKPHPTPNPDGLHAGGSSRGTGFGADRSQPEAESATDEPNYDSCHDDDLDTILSQPIPEPDPALRSKGSTDAIARTSRDAEAVPRDAEAVPSFLQEPAKQPRTSEIFKGLGHQTGGVTHSTAGTGKAPLSSLGATPSSSETMFEGSLDETSQSCVTSEHGSRDLEWASDDDHHSDSRIPWALLVLMSYSSAVTLALTWALWTGRSFRSAESPSANTSQTEGESVPKIVSSSPVGVLPPLAAENVASLGKVIRIGGVEVTPVGIEVTRLELVRSIDPADWRREKLASLVLRLRLKNISKNDTFAPLELRFVREQASTLDRSMIATSPGQAINLFPLAVDSEWSIDGQEFSVLEPGESVETLIASEPGAADRLTDLMTWHVRLRIAPYRTDVLGVRFSKDEVEDGSRR
jgi:hypothetical protein